MLMVDVLISQDADTQLLCLACSETSATATAPPTASSTEPSPTPPAKRRGAARPSPTSPSKPTAATFRRFLPTLTERERQREVS